MRGLGAKACCERHLQPLRLSYWLTSLRFLPADAEGDGSGAGNTAVGICSAGGAGGAARGDTQSNDGS